MTYRHVERADAPQIVLLYSPRKFPGSKFQVSLTAAELPHLIVDLNDLSKVVDHFERSCGEPLLPSEVELTLDFPVEMFPKLLASIYVPGVSDSHFAKDEKDEEMITYYFGSRRSATSAKLYSKSEAGHKVARVELTIRCDALRPLGINTVYDLAHAKWSEIFTRRVRFVEFVERPGHNDWVQWGAASYLASGNTVNGVLLRLKKRSERRLLQRHLRDLPLTDVVRDALRAFERQLAPNCSEGCDCSLCTPGHANGSSSNPGGA